MQKDTLSVAAVALAIKEGRLDAAATVWALVEHDPQGTGDAHVEAMRADAVQIPEVYVVGLTADAAEAEVRRQRFARAEVSRNEDGTFSADLGGGKRVTSSAEHILRYHLEAAGKGLPWEGAHGTFERLREAVEAQREGRPCPVSPDPQAEAREWCIADPTSGTLPRAQLARALALARAHSHGWATEFDALGIDEAGRNESWEEVPGTERGQRAWERTRREKLERADPAELAALRRVEEAWAAKGEVVDADLHAISLIGSEAWPETLRSGIWSPGLDADGDTYHETGTGRLSWLVARDGATVLYVNRPGQKLFKLGASVVGGAERAHERVQAVLDGVLPARVRGTPVYEGEGLARLRTAAERIRLEGLGAVVEDGVDLAEGEAGVRLYLQEDGCESVSVLRAAVTPKGEVVVQRQVGPGLYYRHVETLVRAIAYLGVQWEPAVELA